MRRRTRWVWLAAVGLGEAAGCRGGKADAPAGPRLEVRWTGSDTAAFRARATAEWCDSLNLLQVLAIAGDTGVGIAIYPREGVATGDYPVRPPASADSVPPSAAIGLRWFSKTAVQGYQSDSGHVTLTRAPDGELAGRFTASARAIAGNGRLTVSGSFADLRQRPATRGCSTANARPRSEPSDSDVGVD